MKGIEQNLEKYISDQDITKRVKEISNEISRLYCDKNPILIGVLNGSFIFLSDLIRHLNIHCEVDFIKISSYVGKKSVGEINMTKGLDLDIKNRSVIIIEDIIDSGKSIKFLYDYISNCEVNQDRGEKEIATAIQNMINDRNESIKVFKICEHVPDLTYKNDIDLINNFLK